MTSCSPANIPVARPAHCAACASGAPNALVRSLRSLEIAGEQRSEEWLQKRRQLVTASEMASALCQNPYESRVALLRKKVGVGPVRTCDNVYTRHGNENEAKACVMYEKATGHKVVAFGLLQSNVEGETHLGGSPDGITFCGRLVEIKCPVTREIIPGLVPAHYTPQLLTLMHIAGLKVADFVQWRTDTGVFDITEFHEDADQWYAAVAPRIKDFYTLLMDCHLNPSKVPLPKKRKRKAAAPKYVQAPEPAFADAFIFSDTDNSDNDENDMRDVNTPSVPAQGGNTVLVPGGPPPPLTLEPACK
tara:strand:- start:1743 stop:2654 length:912 start_codon:yes stop_codon:yes gene_type:complete